MLTTFITQTLRSLRAAANLHGQGKVCVMFNVEMLPLKSISLVVELGRNRMIYFTRHKQISYPSHS